MTTDKNQVSSVAGFFPHQAQPYVRKPSGEIVLEAKEAPVSPIAEEPWWVRAGLGVAPTPKPPPTEVQPGTFPFGPPQEPMDYAVEYERYYKQLEESHANLNYVGSELERYSAFFGTPLQKIKRIVPFMGMQDQRDLARMTDYMQLAGEDIKKNEYFAGLYAVVPNLLAIPGKYSTVEDILARLPAPESLSVDEMDAARATIQAIIDNERLHPSLTQNVDELIKQATEVLPLQIPEGATAEQLEMAAVHNLTIADLVKTFQARTDINPVLTPEEWKAIMTDMGYSDADLEAVNFIEGEAERIADEWVDAQNAIDEFMSGIRDIPDYTITRAFKDFWVQPGLALLETVLMYREHVAMPLGGKAWRHILPDMEAEYQRYRKSDSDWVAARKAFDNYDTNWFLKYMIMESITDPLTYVGWGIAGRMAKALPWKPLTKIAAFERGFMEVVDIPFDLVKLGWRKIPKTIGQRAMSQQQVSGQVVKRYMDLYAGNKTVFAMPMGEFAKARQAAVKYYLAHPQSEDLAALAGKEFLRHRPFDLDDTTAFIRALGVDVPPTGISKYMVESLDEVFEDYFFRHMISKDEAASQALKVMGVNATPTARKAVGGMLEARGTTILKASAQLDAAATPHKALRALMRRNYDVVYDTEKTLAAIARMDLGRHATLLDGLAVRATRIWSSKIDKYVVKPFAEAYLCFGMYGPMNVAEDYIRSALGGVRPRRMNLEAWEKISWGLTTDTNLERYAASEMLGYMERKGAEYMHDNWVLQMAFLGRKKWSTKAYEKLVRSPGAIGMEVRRNFIAGRYGQVLWDYGGDAMRKIAASGPDIPTIVSSKFTKNLKADVFNARLAGPELVRGLKDSYTRKALIKSDVMNILSEYPDIPQAARKLIVDSHNSGALWKNIDDVMEQSRAILRDDFVRSPEFATRQMEELKDILVRMDVKSPEEMAWAMQQIQVMCESYGALPRQVMAQSSIRTRGMPATTRQAAIDADFIRLYEFLDKAGLHIDDTITALRARASTAGFTSEQVGYADRMLEIMHMKRQAAADFRAVNMATRTDIFSKTPKNMRNNDFWENFYVTMDGQYMAFEKADAKLFGLLEAARETMDSSFAKLPVRQPIKVAARPLAPEDIAKLMQCRGDDISRALLDVLTVNSKPRFTEYILSKVKPGDVGFTREAIENVYDQIVSSLGVKPETFSYITKSNMQIEGVRRELHNLYISNQYPDDVLKQVYKYIDDQADELQKLMYTPKGNLRKEFTDWQSTRQKAMDEAHKWYYKEYPDYTNANAFDAMMKLIYPYWTYESQRWFWLPRTFVRHPGMFVAFEKWQDNTDYGYIHLPGTSADINPFRGTVFGALTTRLVRRDYPEYYDSLPVAGDFVEGMDFLSRWGFYPGAHFSIPLAIAGGLDSQAGETLPSMHKSLLNILIAEFPDSKAVEGLSELIFNDRFRDYATILQINRRGGDGVRIWTKIQSNVQLTDAEQAIWNESRQEAAAYGILFEQFGLFRMRPDEQHQAYELASKVIEEKTGISPRQQDLLRRRGERLWDLVGGLSPTNQAVLQSLDYYKWVGLKNPLLPGRMQLIQNKITLFWEDVENFNNKKNDDMLQVMEEFRSGIIGPRDYITEVTKIYDEKRGYVDTLHEALMYKEVPLTLEERAAYYEQTGNTLPVMHPMRELMNLYFEIEPIESINPETMEKELDWDTFWAQRNAIEAAIPDQFKQEWQDYLSRNTTPYEQVRRQINDQYFRPYNVVYEAVLEKRSPEEQALINEYMALKRLEKDRARQEAITEMVGLDGKKLISSFSTDTRDARRALRFANPMLDAWLNFWGRTHSFLTPEAEVLYQSIQTQMQRQ